MRAQQKKALGDREAVDRFLDILNCRDISPGPGVSKKEVNSLFPAYLMSSVISDSVDDGLLYTPNPEGIEVMWPLDHSFVGYHDGAFTLHKVKTISLKEARGRITRPHPKVFFMQTAVIKGDGSKGELGQKTYWAVNPGGLVQDITNWANPRGRGWGQSVKHIAQAAGMVPLTHHYLWHVVIGKIDSPVRMKLPSTPKDARAFLSLRDVPDGLQRRAALRHWVSNHTRKLANGETEVKDHLRGREYFRWDEFEGWIEPSAYDMRRVGSSDKQQ